LVTGIATYVAGIIFGFGFFGDTNLLYIVFGLFVPFTLAMTMFSFFLSTLSPTLKAANAISYGIVLFAIVV
jgi:ABC-type transport system involved in multi-copper enzyme maturation permease subunit